MPQILRTTIIRDAAQAADGVVNVDLPVNPLSAILITVRATNSTATIGDYSSLETFLAMITNARVTFRGATIIDGSLTDLAIMYGCLSHWMPAQVQRRELNLAVRALTVPLLFGRRPYDPMECFPATRRGDLILSLTTDVAVVGLGSLILQAETIELLDATPEKFLKVTTTSKVNAAAGQHEIELPISNDILGVLLRSAVVPLAGGNTSSFGQVAVQVDNVETVYSETNWESLHGELNRKLGNWPHQPHTHGFAYDGSAVGVQQAFTREQQENFAILDNYAYLDLDPLEDGRYALKTAGAARVNLKITDDVGSATAVRVLPVECVLLAAPGA